MVVSTRNSLHVKHKPDLTAATTNATFQTGVLGGAEFYKLVPARAQVKANSKQLQHLLAVYELLSETGQITLASKTTGLYVPVFSNPSFLLNLLAQIRVMDSPLDVQGKTERKKGKETNIRSCFGS